MAEDTSSTITSQHDSSKETADEEIKDLGKKFALALCSASTKSHVQTGSALIRALDRAETLEEAYIKGFVSIAVSVINRRRYRDTRLILTRLIAALARVDKRATALRLCACISPAFPDLPNITGSIAADAKSPAKWLALTLAPDVDDDLLANTVTAFASLAFYAASLQKTSEFEKSLKVLLKTVPNERIIAAVKVASADSSHGQKILALIGFLDKISNLELSLLFADLFAKNILLAKTPPPSSLLNIIKYSAAKLTADQFKEHLLPHVKKSLLRSPEVAVHGIGVLFDKVQFEFDAFAADVFSGLQGSIPNVPVAIECLAQLSCLCSDAKNITKYMDLLTSAASTSKSSDAKILLVNSVGKSAKNRVPPGNGYDQLAQDVMSKVLKLTDASEDFVKAQWSAVASWASRLSHGSAALDVPFKDAIKASAAIRHIAYLNLADLLTAQDSKMPPAAEKLLWAEVDASFKDPLDAFMLGAVLLQAERVSDRADALARKLAENEAILKNKSLAAISPEFALKWLQVLEWIIQKQKTQTLPVLRSLVLLLLWPSGDVRRKAHEVVARLLTREAQSTLAEMLAEQAYAELKAGSLDENLRKVKHSRPISDQWSVPGEWLVPFLDTLLASSKDSSSLAVHTLLLASTPRLVEVDGSVWLRWVHGLQHSGADHTWLNANDFRKEVVLKVLKCVDRQVRDNALITLVSSGLSGVRSDLWTSIEADLMALDAETYVKIPERNVAIFRVPDGQLFNTEVLEIDEGAGVKNMKRENKAYSYAEQLAELELRRELAEKMRKEGKLTTKQKAALEKELAKEKEVRTEMSSLFVPAELALDEARAMVEADHHGAFLRSHILFERGLPLAKSYLVSKNASALFSAYCAAALGEVDPSLRTKISYWTLKLNGSKWLPEAYTSDSAQEALEKLLTLLQNRAIAFDGGDDDEDDAMLYEDMVSAPELLMLFPLLRGVIEGSYEDSTLLAAVNFVKSAINRKFLRDNSVLSIPVIEYADLIIKFVSRVENESLRISATTALTNLIILINDTADTGSRVVNTVRRVLQAISEESDRELRKSFVEALSANQLITRLVNSVTDEEFVIYCLGHLFIVRFDDDEGISAAGNELWEASLLHSQKRFIPIVIDECASNHQFVRNSANAALFELANIFPDTVKSSIETLEKMYNDIRDAGGAVFDEMGRLQKDVQDESPKRHGIASALFLLASVTEEPQAEQLINVVVPRGLDDPNAACREVMRNAAAEAIRLHGSTIMPRLLPFLENLLDKTPDGKVHDNLRQGLVVLLGTLAQYIDPSSDKVKIIVSRLMDTLSTPSETVQQSVSRCLSPLVPAIPDLAKEYVEQLQVTLFEGATYGERRGAAFGIAGLVKGLRLKGMQDIKLIPKIMESLSAKKNDKKREGALLILEILSSTFGRLFEPYMVKALPALLVCFGDANNDVRQAADDAARAMMRSLTPYGTKLVLPDLLAALDDEAWRTKCAAAELLGSMAHCAPRQLSSCLPSIVPKLIEIVTDSHVKVRASGEKALREIAKVIRNPEILGVVNQIMQGLIDPAMKTSFSLQAILNTKFVHYIDAPSLALIMPVVRRAFEDRNSETRRFAAQIISNIYSLTEHKDMEPYLPQLVPGLQKSLIDPVPEIRAVAAKALGAVISKSTGKMRNELEQAIVPWLEAKLVDETSTVDRSGAAQGLAEVLAGLDGDQLAKYMQLAIDATESPDTNADARDGYILLYIYIPMVFKDRFLPYIPRVIPPILKNLADENEYVRASALKAGQRLIAQFSAQARKLLLPQLQRALFDENWRIRLASVQLIGDFLFNICGVTGKSTTDTANDDDTMAQETTGKLILRMLGLKSRDEVLSGLYLARSDVALIVRQAAGHVWKIVVPNTPRTVKEIMKTLFENVVECLASDVEERRQMGARCLGELVRKMGEKILNEVLPILESNLASDDVAKRIGVAIALHEIIRNVSRDVLQHYLDQIVGPIKTALTDPEEHVREEAATTFSRFYLNVGNDALDEIIAPLLEKMTPDQTNVLSGLCSVMKLNSKHMLPYLLPKLTKPPINVYALCSLAEVAGDSLTRQLPKILDALLENCKTNDETDPMIELCSRVVIAVDDPEGAMLLLSYLLAKAQKNNVPSVVLLHTFLENTSLSYEHVEIAFPGILQLYNSENTLIINHAISSMFALVQAIEQKQVPSMIPVFRKQLNLLMGIKKRSIPGFAHRDSFKSVFPLIRDGLVSAGPETKEMTAECLSLIVQASTPDALKVHVTNICGPLIRALGERFSSSVRSALLQSLIHLLDKVPQSMRAFTPQLQSTFYRTLQETESRSLRLVAAGGLRRFIPLHPRPDPIVKDMFKVLCSQQDNCVMEALFVASREMMPFAAAKIPADILEDGFKACTSLFNTPVESPNEQDNALTMLSGALLGQMALLTDQIPKYTIFEDVESCSKPRVRLAKAYAFQQMCLTDPKKIWAEYEAQCHSAVQGALAADGLVAQAAIRGSAFLLIQQDTSVSKPFLAILSKALNHQNVDVRKTVSVALGHVLSSTENAMPLDILKTIVPALVNGSKESNAAVRGAAEVSLVHAFRLQSSRDVFDAYIAGEKGAAKDALQEVYDRTLKRIVKHNEYDLEKLNNITAAP